MMILLSNQGSSIMFYKWNDSMSVGVPLIDNDHRALIHLINRLHESVRAQDA